MDEFLHKVFSLVCHQEPARSYELASGTVFLCARCSGVYAGVLAATVSAVLARVLRRSPVSWFWVLIFGIAVFSAPSEVLMERWTTMPAGNLTRLSTGFLTGAGIAWLLWLPHGDQRTRCKPRLDASVLAPSITFVVVTIGFFLLLYLSHRHIIAAFVFGFILLAGVLALLTGVSVCACGLVRRMNRKGSP